MILTTSTNRDFAEGILAELFKRKVKYYGDPVFVEVELDGWVEVIFLSLKDARPVQKRIRFNAVPVIAQENFADAIAAFTPELLAQEVERLIEDIRIRNLLKSTVAGSQAIN